MANLRKAHAAWWRDLLFAFPSRPDAGRPARSELLWLAGIVLLGAAARVVALLLLDRPVISDGAAYLEMARTVLAPGPMRDIYGNAALYSPGYPFLLSAAFLPFGVDAGVARGVNLVLACIAIILTWALGREASGRPAVGLLAAGGFATLIPSIASVDLLEREHLSIALLLLFLWLCLRLIRSGRPALLTAAIGVTFGCALLGGVSVLFTGLVFPAALLLRKEGFATFARRAALFAACVLALLAPWVMHVDSQVGRPMLSTNGGINLYVGHNPAATGYFVSLADTPAGLGWEERRKRLGEAGLSDYLTERAVEHALSDPLATAALTARKLVYFWLPDTPDLTDEDHGPAIRAIRWLGAAQHALLLGLVFLALAGWRRWPAELRVLLLAVLAYWAIHGMVYVILRYRMPAMPLVMVIAAIPVADRLRRTREDQARPPRLAASAPI